MYNFGTLDDTLAAPHVTAATILSGGEFIFLVAGTFPTDGTVTVQTQSPSGAWIDTDVSFTSGGVKSAYVAAGLPYRFSVSGNGVWDLTDLYAIASRNLKG